MRSELKQPRQAWKQSWMREHDGAGSNRGGVGEEVQLVRSHGGDVGYGERGGHRARGSQRLAETTHHISADART
eukprot:3773369-Rhodomonas_salina.3